MTERASMDVHEIADWIAESSEMWGARVQDARSARVYPGSEIDQDVPLVFDLTPGHVAWRSIGTAGEHLGALHQILSATELGVLVKPYQSLARATMLGAARALYVLEPEDAGGRRAHALQFLRAEADDLQRLVGDWEKASDDPIIKDVRREADAFLDECKRQLTRSGLKEGSTVSETSLLLAVAHHLGDGVADPVAAVMDVWRFASGTAHARTWPWEFKFEDQSPVRSFARVWSVPLGLLEHAWELWNRRRGDL